jgi:D-glucosaminate-6-phosphate ammonia-lyase
VSVYERFGVRTIINVKGPATRLSGGIMRPEVVEAMAEASQHCVDMAELQAAASREIAAVTGAEAGYVASGAAACLLLAAAACMAGLDLPGMARLPDTRGMRDEIVMVRSQRNLYDHAVRAAGATIVEVGLPDRYAGAGVRDAALWEIEAAIGERTAAVFHVAGAQAQPPLAAVSAVAARHGVPVIVDAAAQLPPQANLRRFIEDGADLVAFSGGKAIGGPQASGFLCGRRDLVMSAALQHLDLDVFEDTWRPPAGLIDRDRLNGVPQHGVGRSCKVGKEEIVGLLTALRTFVAEGDAARHRQWLSRLEPIEAALKSRPGIAVTIENRYDTGAVPRLAIALGNEARSAQALAQALIDREPSIHVDTSRRAHQTLIIDPVAFSGENVAAIIEGLTSVL